MQLPVTSVFLYMSQPLLMHQNLLSLKWNLTVSGAVKDQKMQVKRKKLWEREKKIAGIEVTITSLLWLGWVFWTLSLGGLFSLPVYLFQTPRYLTKMTMRAHTAVVVMCACESSVKSHTVISHSLAKRAATYMLLLRDLLPCASLLLPAQKDTDMLHDWPHVLSS